MVDQAPVQPELTIPQIPKTGRKVFPIIILVVLCLGFGGSTAYLAYRNQQLSQQLSAFKAAPRPTPQPTFLLQPDPTSLPTTTPEDTGISWKRTKFGGLFTYEYPEGWHVADRWPDDFQTGVMILIDPDPISSAPRGGPLATFTVTVKNGLPNPNQVLKEDLQNFKNLVYDFEEETIESELGPVYHYKGKIKGEMWRGEPREKYFFTFETSPNDPINQQVVSAELLLTDDPKLPEMLRRIVLSFKKGPS